MTNAPRLSQECFDMLRQIKADPTHNPSDVWSRQIILSLHRVGLITDFIAPYGRRLTPEGEEVLRLEDERLAAEEKAAEEKAQREAAEACKEAAYSAKADEDRKKQFRHDWRIAIFQVVGGFVVGAVTDHLFDIVGNASRAVIIALTALGLLH